MGRQYIIEMDPGAEPDEVEYYGDAIDPTHWKPLPPPPGTEPPQSINTHDALQAENERLREQVRELDTVRWAKLAAPNARICYGRRKRLNGETLLFGNEEMHWGIQLWTISSGVATDQSGNWEFLDAVEWWSYSLPPLPDALLTPQEPNNG